MSGILGSIFSFGDRLKKRARGLLNDPVNQVKTNLETWAADANEAMQTPEGIASMMLGNGLLGRVVYHGSPHRFDRFDSSKIGTGEGAQAYGHGLYFAESPVVAEGYKNQLTGGGVLGSGRFIETKAGQIDTYQTKNPAERLAYQAFNEGIETGWNKVDYLANNWTRNDPVLRSEVAAILDKLQRSEARLSEGALYKVDLPDEAIARMLDWDKPLSQQAPEVQAALNQIGDEMTGRFGKTMTGDRALSHIQNTLRFLGRGDEKAEAVLRSKGIPGIRYLDGGSRGAGQGTSNFVVFPGNEGLLTILERNGMPIR